MLSSCFPLQLQKQRTERQLGPTGVHARRSYFMSNYYQIITLKRRAQFHLGQTLHVLKSCSCSHKTFFYQRVFIKKTNKKLLMMCCNYKHTHRHTDTHTHIRWACKNQKCIDSRSSQPSVAFHSSLICCFVPLVICSFTELLSAPIAGIPSIPCIFSLVIQSCSCPSCGSLKEISVWQCSVAHIWHTNPCSHPRVHTL